MHDKLPFQFPIIGDDKPYITQYYRDVPSGFRFDNLVFPTDKPLTLAVKDKLIDFANRYYRKWEIVGITYVDFFEDLQLSLDENIDTLEKLLEVYDDDIAKPTQSRTIKRTHDATDTDTGTANLSSEVTGTNENTTKDYDLPVDNPTASEVSRTTINGTSGTSTTNESNDNRTVTRVGEEIEEWSDVGVAPNYVLLNGFLDNNRTYYQVFVGFFKNNFTLTEWLTW